MNFNALQKATRISPRILRKHLDELIKKKLVQERGKPRKRGQKLWYVITPIGENHAIKAMKASVEDTSLIIKSLAKNVMFFKDQEKKSYLRRALKETDHAYVEDLRAIDSSMDKTFDWYVKTSTRGLLTNSLKELYRLYLEVMESGHKEGSFMGITKGGAVFLISVPILENAGVLNPDFRRQFSFL